MESTNRARSAPESAAAQPAPASGGKGRRVTIDLSPGATAEVDRLRGQTGLTTADLFRFALSLLRIYVSARAEGKHVRVLDPASPAEQVQIELPISVSRSEGGR